MVLRKLLRERDEKKRERKREMEREGKRERVRERERERDFSRVGLVTLHFIVFSLQLLHSFAQRDDLDSTVPNRISSSIHFSQQSLHQLLVIE